ncbi:MAG TPA: chemotaxis protein CheA [Candidatus Sulfotelmatobacter sp.]|nr:chemotaxis protein CheA [Candidatus Sulfotelmatobacter sp.]
MTDHPPDERGLELRELFFETSQELLQALNEEALKLEKKPGDEEIVRVIRRTVHTLKGDSAACGMRELSELAHQFEDALSLEGTATQAAVAEIAFAAADVFAEMIAAYRTGGKLPSTKNLSKRISDLTAAPASISAKNARTRSIGSKAAGSKSTTSKTASSKSTGRKSSSKSSSGSSSKTSKKSAVKASASRKSAGKTAAAKRTAAKTTTAKMISDKMVSDQSAEAKSATATTSAARTTAKVAAHWTEYENMAMQKAQAAGLSVYHAVVKIDPHCAMPIAGRQLIHNALSSVGQVIAVHPDAKSPAASKYVEFVLASTQTVPQIQAKGRIPTIAEEVTVELMLAPSPAPQKAAYETDPAPEAAGDGSLSDPAVNASETPSAAPAAAVPATSENLLRVEAGRIDSVLNLVGELIIGKSMLQQALNEFSKRYPKELLRGKFADAMAFQARVLNDLQRSVMKIRMVPVDQLFRRFPRMVRDVSRQCGREVEVDISGQDTDLDKGILDAIAEPLTHLVRNAVSHGIEPPDERRKLGKAARGVIRLNAYHHGNQVVVEVIDDGRGIDAQKIRAKAIELGMTTAEEAARLSEAETLEFIFRPGFSTAEQVTEVSGRGVGMDVVQSVLHRLKATISVETRPGQGTTFRLKLPLTLAIIKALLFWVEQRLYAIPLNAVLEIARTFETEVHQVDNYEVLQLRNQVLPLLRLGRPVGDDRKSKLFVLVITVGERKYGLIVDALEGEEELVIKALDDHTFHTDLVSGASILGDGRVVLILNLPAVVEHVARARPEQLGQCNSGLLLSHTDRARLAMAPIMTPAMGGQA